MAHRMQAPSVMQQTMLSTVVFGVAALLVLTPTRPAEAEVPAQTNAPSKAGSDYGPDIADELGDEAVKANPSIAAITHGVDALKQRVSGAGAWMDPIFSAEYSNMPIDSPVPGSHPMSGIQLMLKQTFYWPGKIRAREEEAKSLVRERQNALAEQKVQLRAAVRLAYYRLALTRQLREVTQAHVKLVGDFIQVVRVKNEAGVAAQHEYLRLRVLAEQLQDDLNNFDQDEQSLTATINSTLHRALGTPVPTPKQTTLRGAIPDVPSLVRRAERERPLLNQYRAEAAAHRAAARRAEREGYPDITLWAGYRIRTAAGTDPGTDFASVGVAVPLPFWYDRRWGSKSREQAELAAAATERRAAELDGMRGQLGRVVAAWKRAEQEARTYRDQLTPAARLSLQATFASYQVDRADFASLFQAEVQLLNFERTTRMAEANAAEARVQADAIVGSGVK